MTNKEKIHDIKEAFRLIEVVAEDTDDSLWAKEMLNGALAELKDWLKEGEI